MKNYYKKIRHIIEYVFFEIFIRSMKLIGYKNSVRFCRFIAKFMGPYFKVNKIAEKNLNKAFKSKINTKKILPQIWDNFGQYIGEFPFVGNFTSQEIQSMFTVEGVENVKYYQEKKQPFLIFSAHQANWDLIIKIITNLHPKVAFIYRKANNPYVDKKILAIRSKKPDILMIEKGHSGARKIIQAIKNNYSIAMLVDQKMNNGIEVPFFGQPAMTANAIAKLSLQYNYPIIPYQMIRVKNSKFKVIIHPKINYQITDNKENDIYNIMLFINQTLEKWVREEPAQWFWFHNRWKD